MLTAGEASLLAVGAEGCGKWIPQEFAACHPDPSAAFSTASITTTSSASCTVASSSAFPLQVPHVRPEPA